MVALPPDPGIANLAAANPQAQFLAVGIPGVTVTSNLSQIGSDGERPDQQGFLAGYLAAVITPDWRVGVISQSDSPAGKAAQNGFTNGVIFYCGLCRPSYPPFIQYPILVDLAAGTDPQAAVDSLVSNAVKTVYVSPAVEDPGAAGCPGAGRVADHRPPAPRSHRLRISGWLASAWMRWAPCARSGRACWRAKAA